MNFSERLKEKRREKGLTQLDVAREIGVTQSVIAQYELGIKVPTISIAAKLSTILEISLDELVKGSEYNDDRTNTGE